MNLNELDEYFKNLLNIDLYQNDPSMNGVQIQNSNPNEKQIKKIAFAVDACEKTVLKAVEQNADLLFVHHGLLWGNSERITESFYKRVSPFIKNDICLYACHIPLDANNPLGNNYGLANKIGLKNQKPFGIWRGMEIGVKGEFEKPITIEELQKLIFTSDEKPLKILPFGKKQIKTVGIISGGAGSDVYDAVKEKLDVYITGEVSHELYHYVLESEINMIACGHYQSETIGVNLVKEKVKKDLGIETIFIDVPTEL